MPEAVDETDLQQISVTVPLEEALVPSHREPGRYDWIPAVVDRQHACRAAVPPQEADRLVHSCEPVLRGGIRGESPNPLVESGVVRRAAVANVVVAHRDPTQLGPECLGGRVRRARGALRIGREAEVGKDALLHLPEVGARQLDLVDASELVCPVGASLHCLRDARHHVGAEVERRGVPRVAGQNIGVEGLEDFAHVQDMADDRADASEAATHREEPCVVAVVGFDEL